MITLKQPGRKFKRNAYRNSVLIALITVLVIQYNILNYF